MWAAGDCAEARHLVSGKPVSYHLGTIANKQGRVCGINIGGGYATFPGVLGTAVSKVCDVEVARTGLSEAELGELGLEWEQAAVDSTTRAGYFPGAAPIRTKVLAERRSGRLLGAQIVGKEGAAKRIDVFATAIWNGMAVDEMVNLDLSYAPPFSPVWDPVLIAVRKLAEQVERSLGDQPVSRVGRRSPGQSAGRTGTRPCLVVGNGRRPSPTHLSIGMPAGSGVATPCLVRRPIRMRRSSRLRPEQRCHSTCNRSTCSCSSCWPWPR